MKKRSDRLAAPVAVPLGSLNATNNPAFGYPGSDLGCVVDIAAVGASDREMQFALKPYL